MVVVVVVEEVLAEDNVGDEDEEADNAVAKKLGC